MDKELEVKPYSPMWKNPIAQGVKNGKGKHGIVWMPSIHNPNTRYPFKPKQIRVLHAYASGVPLEEICLKLQMNPVEISNLLKRKKCKLYLSELDEMDSEVLARTAKSRVAKEILDVWDGKLGKTREQMEAGKELWSRVWPKPSGQAGNSGDKFEVHINIAKMDEADRRVKAIEAEIVNVPHV